MLTTLVVQLEKWSGMHVLMTVNPSYNLNENADGRGEI